MVVDRIIETGTPPSIIIKASLILSVKWTDGDDDDDGDDGGGGGAAADDDD